MTTAEWKLVQGACTLMEPVKEATLKLEAEKKPTICNVVEQVLSMKNAFEVFLSADKNSHSRLSKMGSHSRKT